jgi:thiamine biosynthesis lipoprotein
MGEVRTLGENADGDPWSVAIEDASGNRSAPISVLNKAVATSGAYGFRFDEQGACNHLFDPRTGECAKPLRTITVVAHTATTADALSTAFTLMNIEAIGSVLARAGRAQAYSVEAGEIKQIVAHRSA